MKKIPKKQLKKKTSSKEQLQQVAEHIRGLLASHGTLTMFIIAGAAIGYALYNSTSYLSPQRNESKYEELSTKTYKKIDYELVTRLSQALNDIDVTISQNKNPERSNPFSE